MKSLFYEGIIKIAVVLIVCTFVFECALFYSGVRISDTGTFLFEYMHGKFIQNTCVILGLAVLEAVINTKIRMCANLTELQKLKLLVLLDVSYYALLLLFILFGAGRYTMPHVFFVEDIVLPVIIVTNMIMVGISYAEKIRRLKRRKIENG
jgi:glucan phosphoethanolaminetransferase (alkaline phosphatase superfamily)